MSDTITIARPYAKSLFEIAITTQQLAGWSAILASLTQVILLPETNQFIRNPAATIDEQVQLMISVILKSKYSVDSKQIHQFVTLLAENKRLLLIPGIFSEYERLRAEQEKTMTVTVSSFSAMSNAQQERMVESLTRRLQRKVSLEINIDKSLLGGALIQAGDLVIDGSVRGQLLKLASSLAV